MSIRTAVAAAFVSLSLCLGAQAQSVTLGQFQHPKSPKDLEVNQSLSARRRGGAARLQRGRAGEAVLHVGPGAETDVRRGKRSGLASGAQSQWLPQAYRWRAPCCSACALPILAATDRVTPVNR